MEHKYSRQREAILRELRSRRDHPSAETLYTALREQYPRISLGTVYRNLTLLCELGEIRKVSCGENTEHYEAVIGDHNHFVCRKCGRIIDISPEKPPQKMKDAGGEIGIIEAQETVYYGLCKDCFK